MTQIEIAQLAELIGMRIALCHKEVLTLDEAAQYVGMTRSALYKLTFSRQIPFSKPCGKRCFFKRIDLEAWLMSNPVATTADLNAQALAYCMASK